MSDILDRRLIASPDAAESPVGDEIIILHLVNGTYYGLDPVAASIWTMIKANVAPAEICRRLAEEHETAIETIEADTRRLLSELEAQGLLVDAGD